MARSGIGLPLFVACLPRADDVDRFFLIGEAPYRIDHDENPSRERSPDPFEPAFVARVRRVLAVQPLGIAEHRCGLFKRNPVLLKVGVRLSNVPGKQICVYT